MASETSMVKGIQASGSEKIIHLQLTVRTGLVAPFSPQADCVEYVVRSLDPCSISSSLP